MPSRPVFPSALPPALTQYPSSVQTNFINVKREACICNIRASCLILDSGFKNGTNLLLKNLPEKKNVLSLDNRDSYKILIVGSNGQVSTLNLTEILNINSINNSINTSDTNSVNTNINRNLNIAQQISDSFEDPLMNV